MPDEEDACSDAPNLGRPTRIGRTRGARGWTVFHIPSTLGFSVLPFRGTPGRRRALAAVPSLQPRRASPYCVLLPPRSSCVWCGVTIVGGEGPTAVGLGARQHDRWHGMDGRHGKRWAGRPPWNPAGFCSCCRGAPRITPSVLVGRSAVYGFRRPCRPRRQDGVPERPRRNTRR